MEKLNISDRDKDFPRFDKSVSPFIYEERIQSGNAILEPINIKDIELIRNWRNNENNNKVFFNNNYITVENQKKWYEKYKNNITDRMFIIYCEHIPVGTVALYNIDYKNNTAEFGRLLIGDLNSRCKNIGLTATKALCEYGFNKLGLNKITLEVYKENVKAFNLYKKVVFKVVKEINNNEVIIMEFYKNK